ncbi:carboxymuconolactone decarboxylase family protein [Carnobacterium iners]|nr:carboxymuconolactone decarboxylase family protein [Carnobacterium iners]
MERIMLAVTQVNGCSVCSYTHTKMALEVGMKSEKIKNILVA